MPFSATERATETSTFSLPAVDSEDATTEANGVHEVEPVRPVIVADDQPAPFDLGQRGFEDVFRRALDVQRQAFFEEGTDSAYFRLAVDFVGRLHQLKELRDAFRWAHTEFAERSKQRAGRQSREKFTVTQVARRLNLSRNGLYARLELLAMTRRDFGDPTRLSLGCLIRQSEVLRNTVRLLDTFHQNE